nr:MAG TPA: hypothetical protein [Caudoviricetes sp.]
MAVNKVIYDGATLVDLTGDTVTADNLAAGVKATGADGKPIVGLLPKVTIDSQLSDSSTNPVQNKVVYNLGYKFFDRLNALADVARTGSYSDLTGTPGNATATAAGLMSAADKAKLDKVDADAGSVKLIIYS